MNRYNPKEIEPKWQKAWEEQKIYQATEDPAKPKKYVLEFFPYPSGAAMHVGHVRNYAIGDAIARYNRMCGYNVLHPMGWDAFGLPAENYAIKNKISPRQAISENTQRFRRQLTQMGFGYDWSREIDSTDPNYYRWTQWFFLLLFKRGLAYQQESLQWWCPYDKTVLANEQVEAGLCWRCGNQVEKKALKQWFFKITDYADRLAKDLDEVDWSDSIKQMQRNWIGRKQGINITYKIVNARIGEAGKKNDGSMHDADAELTVFTTRPDTNFGATFLVLAPEHPFVQRVIRQEIVPAEGPSYHQAVQHYAQKAINKSEIERKEEGRLKTGAFTGFYIVNPLNGKQLPVWVSDFVLAGFGTGAVVGVPGHDMRDFEFAKQFDIPIERVVVGPDGDESPITHAEQVQEKAGVMVNSGPLDGLDIHAATQKMMDLMEERGMGKRVVSYSIRDWLISRQRYWGAPIPIVHCPKDGAVTVPEDQLPVRLPEIESYEPSGDGRSPLATVPEFVHTTCPQCGGPAERETDTMDGFACSSWYFLRFADPHNTEQAFDPEKVKFWLPVDDYIGGAEHAVMHLLYARFWVKVMQDEGLIGFGEPFKKLRNQGMILALDGQKMSKSKGNTIEPDGLIEQGYGADSIRIMELFIGPWNQSASWSVEGMGGAYRFLQRVWILTQEYLAARGEAQREASTTGTTSDKAGTSVTVNANIVSKAGVAQSGQPAGQSAPDEALQKITHKTIKRVSDDLEHLGFNTAIAAQMEMVNELYRIKAGDGYRSESWPFAIKSLLQLLAPFAPHITEELWQQLAQASQKDSQKDSIHQSAWPTYDEQYLAESTVTVVVQVNGKLRGQLQVVRDADQSEVEAAARADSNVASHMDGKEVIKAIFVPNKLVNFVVK